MHAGADGRADPEFRGWLVRRELRAWLFAAFAAFVTAGAALALAPRPPAPWPVPLLGAVALLPFLGARRARRVRASAGPGWVAFDEGRRRPISAGRLHVDVRGVATVRLRAGGARGPRLELGAESAEQGRRLLRALRVDAASATEAFVVVAGSGHALARDAAYAAGATGAFAVGVLALRAMRFFAAAKGLVALVVCLALMPAGVVAFVAWLRRRHVRAEVGVDGVATRSPYGRAAYYPFERVEAIADRRLEVVLTERSGARASFSARGVDEFEAFAQRLVESFALFRASRAEGEGWQVLLPAEGVATPDWLARLRVMGAGGARGYRALGLERPRLVGLAEAPHVPPLGRAAAAFVLFERLAPGELERVRAAAASSAHPGLRAALAAVVRGDRVETGRAMGELRDAASGAWGELGGGRR